MNTKAFYKLNIRREKIEDQLETINSTIEESRVKAKKLPKGSEERKAIMTEISDKQNSLEVQLLKKELATLNFCINITFYN